MTTKERSAHASKGLPVNHCSGFRIPNSTDFSETDGKDISLFIDYKYSSS